MNYVQISQNLDVVYFGYTILSDLIFRIVLNTGIIIFY